MGRAPVNAGKINNRGTKTERISPYGDDIAKRIDEIIMGDIHIEMTDVSSAHMRIGKKAFFIGVDRKGQLIIKFLWDER